MCVLEIHDLHCSPNIIRAIKLRRMKGGACKAYGGEERFIEGLVGKPVGKRPLRRTRRRWEDNIKMDLQEVECGMEH